MIFDKEKEVLLNDRLLEGLKVKLVKMLSCLGFWRFSDDEPGKLSRVSRFKSGNAYPPDRIG